jgi:branched-chain amino acid transport system substrate-binding protein
VAGAALVAYVAGACASAPPVPVPDEPEGPPAVVLERGTTAEADESRAAELVGTARTAHGEGRHEAALEAASAVVDGYPATAVSGDALELVARSAAALERWDRAGAAAARLHGLLPDGDGRAAEMVVIEARALAETGDPAAALTRLLSLPPRAADPADEADPALVLAREVSNEFSLDELTAALDRAPDGHRLAAPVRVARATALLLAGDPAAAAREAQRARADGAVGEDDAAARSVLEGRLPDSAGPLRFGLLLPLSGSPALQRFAQGIRDGAQAALVASGLEDLVELEVLDTGGDAATTRALVRSAEEQGVLGMVGPLDDVDLATAAGARSGGLVLLSPSADAVPAGPLPGVYSLGATDPGAPRALAEWAARAGIGRVAIVHASRGASAEEARLFAQAFSEAGGRVLRTLTYEPGATYFAEQIQAVHALRPDALLLPVPPEDVQALAPQVTFFGLDTLGVQVLGTSGWTDAATLQDVSPRHLDGVVAAAPRRPDRDAEDFRRFVEAYETHFRRSLVDPALPALGYDAASLVLQAMRSGARSPDALRRALERVEGFPGATGLLSFRDGRVLREHHVVCLWSGQLRPLDGSERPEPLYRPYPTDPDEEAPPEGPGRPAGFMCPGVLEPL